MMSRSTRSSLFALLTAGLITLGATGCFSQDMADVVPFDAEAQSAEGQSANDSAEGVTRTLAGELTYLAPNEYLVENQAFHIDETTRVLGGINVCPAEDGVDGTGYGIVECSYEELDAAVQGGTAVLAEVAIVDGFAESISEYQTDGHGDPESDSADVAPAEGVTTTLTGEVTYLAPYEYLVGDQAFYVDETTEHVGGIYVCAGPEGLHEDGHGNLSCPFGELETALAQGTFVYAEVAIVDGIATTILEYQA